MPDDDNNPYADRNKLVVTDNGGVAFAAIVASGVVAYVRDIHASVAQVFGRRGLVAALREEQALAKLAIIALAVAADGEITEVERTAIQDHAKTHKLDATEMLAEVARLGEELRDPKALRDRINYVANPLDASDRLEVFTMVTNLAHRGSRAWPPPNSTSYRGATAPTPEALIAIFRDALNIESAESIKPST